MEAYFYYRPYDDYDPHYSKFELNPYNNKIIINENNIEKFKYIKEEIDEFLYTRKNELSIKNIEIKIEIDPFFYNSKILDYYKDISFEEACMYDLSTDEEGEIRLIEGDSGSIHITKDDYKITFRYAEQCLNWNRRELRLFEE